MRMLDGGCDPRYIARRLMRMSVEDIGLADPRAMDVAVNAAEIYERLGSPEGDLALGEAAVYLACAPKSNAIEVAMKELRIYSQRRISSCAHASEKCAYKTNEGFGIQRGLSIRAR